LEIKGFQIVTVDGANVTIEYYAAVVPIDMSLSINKGATSELQIPSISAYTFAKQETYGYSLQGKEFVLASGANYTQVQDNSSPVAAGSPTVAQILSGANGVSLVKVVNTGWKAKAEAWNSRALASDIFYLWGMGAALGSDQTDTFTLSLSYDSAPATASNESSYGLGTYGVDTNSKTAWAVVNSNGQFAVKRDIEAIPGLLR
jgi:hypothetical protein